MLLANNTLTGYRRAMRFAAAILLALIAATPAWALDRAPKVEARLIAEHSEVAPGGSVRIGLYEKIRPGWHTYWRYPGDSGEPTSITWALPPGWKAGEIQWPYPERLPVGPLMNYGYENSVLLPVAITAPANAPPISTVTLRAHVTWLVCEEVCIPEEQGVEIVLGVGAPGLNTGKADPLFAEWDAKIPHPSPWSARYRATDTDFSLFIAAPELASAGGGSIQFFPNDDGMIENAAEQQIASVDGGLLIATKPGWKLKEAAKRAGVHATSGVLVVTDRNGETRALEIEAKEGAVPAMPAPGGGLLEALLFAFLGGLILNLMPCVLPILSMKALALAGKGGASQRDAFSGTLVYTLGVLLTFSALAVALIVLRAGGEAIGWGFQLQEPIAVGGFALLMVAVGLNLSGVFEVPGIGAGGSLAAHGGWIGSFFTGVLAVAVAAPCTAPFMGVAMGFALTQPAVSALAVFVALGLGFAAPFMLLGIVPATRRFLPKPGAWMETLRQVLAFAMYGTAIWLVWVLSQQAGSDGVLIALVAMLALAFAAWSIGKHQRGAGCIWNVLAAIAFIGALAALPMLRTVTVASPEQSGPVAHEAYTPERLAALRAQSRGVFVNATAAWCITCLVNEKVALSTPGVTDAFKQHNIAYLKADWTNRDPTITALLQSYGRSGVPLYLYFAPGARDAVVLPQILTEGIVTDTLAGKAP